MSRWKQLPDSLDPRVRQLVAHMRRIKDHSGLGLQALAVRTGYSRASWDRYLNGRSLPPQQAVAALARACDIDPARLLALHEVAMAAGRATDTQEEQTPQQEVPEGEFGAVPREGRPGRRRTLATVLAAVLLASAVIALLVAAPWAGRRERTDERPVSATATASPTDPAEAHGAFVFRPGKDHPCPVRRGADGLLHAGYSSTRVALIGTGSTAWSVVEAQCLLRHHGISPGIADGMFGSRTERAVERMQDRAHLRVDGIIGEDTWGVLRK
ncbi:helix-turn-helix domain-containing protein [Streptomyces sp. NPDC127190]|uniref:helix-turn-helix domain-containing protein n=1 Tax=unclassified Streptomyces TaxID=2593676 RepID=UPI0036331D4A